MYRSKCLKFSVLSIEHRSSRANRVFQTRHVSFFPDILPVVYIYTRYLHSVKRASEGERVATEFEFDLTFLLSVRQVSPLFFSQNSPGETQRDEDNDPFSPAQILGLTDLEAKLVCLRFLSAEGEREVTHDRFDEGNEKQKERSMACN